MSETPRGITIMEGLIAGGVIVLLLFATGMMVSSARSRARDYKRLSDVSRIQASLELYFNDVNSYPKTDGQVGLGGEGARCLSDAGFQAACSASGRVYISPVPRQTTIGLKRKDIPAYAYESDGETYVIGFVIERAVPDAQADKGLLCARPGEAFQPARGGACRLQTE